jgi:lantibiotic transport system permease protein
MTTLIRVLRAEGLKMRRTLALALAFVAPLSVSLLEFGMSVQYGPAGLNGYDDPWLWLFQSNLVIWSLIMLPLFITLETALLANMEHNNRMWKKLFSLPVPRWMTIAAKQISALLLIALSCLVLWALTLLMGFVLQMIDPAYGLTGTPPWLSLLGYTGLVFLASWLIIGIQMWVGLNWKSFVVASSFGIIATVTGMMVINSETFGPYYPWALPGLVGNQFNEGIVQWPQVWFGLIGGIVILVLTNLHLSRKQVL